MFKEIEMEIEALQKKLTPEEKRAERIRNLAEDLRGGRKVTDFRFDQVYPAHIRKLSEIHWTPVEVALRASELLVADEKTRVLDVGSGSGKFCITGSLFCQAQFTGVEQRPHLLEAARDAAKELGADRVSFILGNMADLDWNLFDAFYLFNPFYENVLKNIRIDDTVSHSQERFQRYVEIVRLKLRSARAGTRVATYHGFGGELPHDFQLLRREPIGSSYLEIWEKIENIHNNSINRPFL